MSVHRFVPSSMEGWISGIRGMMERLKTPRAQRVLMIGASIYLAGGIHFAVSSLDLTVAEIDMGSLILLMLILVPATLAANVVETELSALI